MQPADVLVITLDGKVHNVVSRSPIAISVHTGGVAPMQIADPANPNNLSVVNLRQPGPVVAMAGTRFTCTCGMSFDAKDTDIDGTGRWTQGAAVDCTECAP